MKVYGIKNCNTMQKAFSLLNRKKIAFEFHDYRKSGIDETTLKQWCHKINYENLINKKGLTWKRLDEKTKRLLTTQENAIKLMMQYPSLIKRPVIDTGHSLIVGWDEKALESLT